MSHEIETMAWAGETPWHGLGKMVPADLSPRQMQEAAGVDWNIKRVKTFYTIGENQIYSGNDALLRDTDDKLLDTVPSSWNHVQNDEAFDFFNDFVSAGDMQMHTAGSLKNGQIVWALAKINDGFDIFGGDMIESFLLFTCPHKFGQAIDVRATPIRVVCNNTLTLALGTKVDNMVKVSHRTKFDAENVKVALGVTAQKVQQYKEMALFLGSKKMKEETVKEYLARVFPTASKDKEMSLPARRTFEVLHTQPGAQYAEGTFWQAFNAVTFSIDHILGRSQETRLESAWYGQNRQKKINALELAVEMAEAA